MKLSAIQKETIERLEQDGVIIQKNVKVLNENLGDIVTQIDTILGSLGICVLISFGGHRNDNTDGCIQGPATMNISVSERPMNNRKETADYITGQDLAEYLAAALHGKSAGDGTLMYKSMGSGVDQDGVIVWNVLFELETGLDTDLENQQQS